jgi:hypothetical protein
MSMIGNLVAVNFVQLQHFIERHQTCLKHFFIQTTVHLSLRIT